MANWFQFNGTLSTSLGVYVQAFPPITLPEERVKFEPIPGRSGSLTLLEGDDVYDDIVLSVSCYIRDDTSLDAITAWLRGAGSLVLGNAPTRYYKARCVNQVELAKVLRGRQYRTFAAVFRCAPYRYVYPEPSALDYRAITNKVANGDFSGGTTGWTSLTDATLTVAAGAGQLLASAEYGNVIKSVGGTIAGHVYYFSALIKATSIYARMTMSTAGVSSSGSGQWERLSGVLTATTTGHTIMIYDGRPSNWSTVYIDDVICVDMTATFGAGNELSAAEMDTYLADRYEDGWFDGTLTSGLITNDGTASAVPTITIVGSGDITLTVGTNTITVDGLTSTIIIDCDTGFALDGSGNDLTPTVSMAEWPFEFAAGDSAVSWTGTVTSVTITRPWRYY